MAKKHKYLFLLSFIFLALSFSSLAQDLRLIPPQTELVGQHKQEEEELVTTSYQYKSRSSKESILEFYRLMFANQGFTEIQGQPPRKDPYRLNYFFTKEQEGTMVLLNFLRLVDEGVYTYFITTYHYSLKEMPLPDILSEE